MISCLQEKTNKRFSKKETLNVEGFRIFFEKMKNFLYIRKIVQIFQSRNFFQIEKFEQFFWL